MSKKSIRDIARQITALAEERCKDPANFEHRLYEVLDELQEEMEFPLPPRYRTKEEIGDAEGELLDKVWYNRHRTLQARILDRLEPPCDPKIWKGALAAARRVEAKYPNETLHWDDFEWGMLNGKLSALRWVAGEEWDFLDT